jgi:hypothetical protein
MTKFRAFAIHLLLSVAVFLLFLGVMFLLWYPAPYFEVDGGWSVLRILVGVDLVLGPLLTLIVFKSGKPGLKFDLSCIALLQLGALLYGGLTIYQQRPQFVVFALDRFTTVPASEVDVAKLRYAELKPQLSVGPVLALARLPQDAEQRSQLLLEVLGGGKDIEWRAEYYEPYRPDLQELKKRSINLQQLVARNADAQQALERFLAAQGGGGEDYLFLPLLGKNKDIVLVLSGKDGLPVGSLSVDPWALGYQKAGVQP